MTTRSNGRATRAAKPGKSPRTRPANHAIPNAENPDEEYRVGPGRPPKEFQFKPGQSGNPKGAKRKHPIVPDLKASLERALNQTVILKQGEKEKMMSKAEMGIERLVNAYAEGDRHARRDLIDLAQKLGVDLVDRERQAGVMAQQTPLSAEDKAVLDDLMKRQGKASDEVIHPPSIHLISSKDEGE